MISICTIRMKKLKKKREEIHFTRPKSSYAKIFRKWRRFDWDLFFNEITPGKKI